RGYRQVFVFDGQVDGPAVDPNPAQSPGRRPEIQQDRLADALTQREQQPFFALYRLFFFHGEMEGQFVVDTGEDRTSVMGQCIRDAGLPTNAVYATKKEQEEEEAVSFVHAQIYCILSLC